MIVILNLETNVNISLNEWLWSLTLLVNWRQEINDNMWNKWKASRNISLCLTHHHTHVRHTHTHTHASSHTHHHTNTSHTHMHHHTHTHTSSSSHMHHHTNTSHTRIFTRSSRLTGKHGLYHQTQWNSQRVQWKWKNFENGKLIDSLTLKVRGQMRIATLLTFY